MVSPTHTPPKNLPEEEEDERGEDFEAGVSLSADSPSFYVHHEHFVIAVII
mgnify:CR=1 FL=1